MVLIARVARQRALSQRIIPQNPESAALKIKVGDFAEIMCPCQIIALDNQLSGDEDGLGCGADHNAFGIAEKIMRRKLPFRVAASVQKQV